MKRKASAVSRPFRPDALTWIDYLVIAAIALTFLAIASTTIGHAKASPGPDPSPQVHSQAQGPAPAARTR